MHAQRNQHVYDVWQVQLITLVEGYLAWKHRPHHKTVYAVGDHTFTISVVGIFGENICFMMQGEAFQPNEPALSPAWLHSMDGNQSAKHLNGSGSVDSRVFSSNYFIPEMQVKQFKDNVRDQPSKQAKEQAAICTSNTGIFILACQHGFVECIAEMKCSRELYVLEICGKDQAISHDIGCSSKITIADSLISTRAKELNLDVIVNAFHGFTHNCLCQLKNHPLYKHGYGNEDLETCEQIFSSSNSMASLIRHTSHFHWKQFLDLHFDQWDIDKYLELTLHIICNNSVELEKFNTSHSVADHDFKTWHQEELQYLQTCESESDSTTTAIKYVESLEKLQFAE
ncbi:hypothetical protein HYDPIDRAFT_102874 [Hydnomerulius pinastri MD-312]|uniref:Unplaced genomic scaffold scaffold_117, whole genome shotgun sequence n=1 Tax=Hydnomerulius pinastri MD-312 TaxID=994086 RepID=A0A0C9W6G1_9AGAM|nr:hypothetical protein HYDPIDRAFT_102874 [Hydnomerulius pinastri MD-312]